MNLLVVSSMHTSHKSFCCTVLASLFALAFMLPLNARAQIVMSELMASNSTNLDEDGDSSDWIEIYNSSDQIVSLENWSLTDEKGDLTKWTFPALTLESGTFHLVWASGKDRRDPTGALHTNFQLNSDGEYLALVKPGGTEVAHAFDPYPRMARDVSWGIGQNSTNLVPQTGAVRYLIPQAANAAANWQTIGYNAVAWKSATMPLSFGEPSRDGLVGHWKLDETEDMVAADSANDNHGALKNGGTWTTGVNDGGLQLDGVDDYVEIPNQDRFNLSESITVACWFRISSFTKTWQALVNKGDQSWRLHRYSNTNFINFTGQNLAGTREVTCTTDVNDGQWHHVAGIYDGSSVRIYIDGVLENSASASGSIAGTTSVVMIGENSDSLGRTFHGAMDDVRIYSRALSAEEVASLSGQSALADEMRGTNASLWIRAAFNASNIAAFDSLQMSVQYEDGFIAYLNGLEIARRNTPLSISFDSSALTDRPNGEMNTPEKINLEPHLGKLIEGSNVLAIHAMNDVVDDAQFLLSAKLTAAENKSTTLYFDTATPGEFNAAGAMDAIWDDVVFSRQRGFPTSAFSLSLSTSEPGAQIRYTRDGSEPSDTHGSVYSGPISISTTSVVRALAVKSGYRSSSVQTHSYIFYNDVVSQPTLPSGFRASWNGEAADYEMDPDIVNNPTYSAQVIPALRSLPTMSIVMDEDDFFGSSGIYANPLNSGVAWERACSVEMITSGGSTAFQENCGIRVYGGVGRQPRTKKHALRLLFKGIYGPTKLRYPLFGEDATDEFDTIILRAGFNNSWHAYGRSDQGLRAQYIRDEWIRRSQLEMGHPSPHGTFVHLFINGLYWGVYNPTERANADFCSSYLGGEKEEWDSLNSYPRNIIDGNAEAWVTAHAIANAGVESEEGYAALAQYVDYTNLADYMLLNFYSGNLDWDDHNWYSGRLRREGEGFKFFSWDSERTLENPTGDNKTGENRADKPSRLHSQLKQNEDYKMLFADRAHKYLYNDGLLTPTQTSARYRDLAEHVYSSIICESARWGDVLTPTNPITRDVEWVAERDRLYNQYFPVRTSKTLEFLRSANMYPQTDAPVFYIDGKRQYAGAAPVGGLLTMKAAAGSIYYTLDGSQIRRTTNDPGENITLLPEQSPKRAFVPSSENGGSLLGTTWTGGQPFDDSAWKAGVSGVGYDEATTYLPYFDIDVIDEMNNKNASVYIRIPFTVEAGQLDGFNNLVLEARYEDGFIAYIDGVRVIDANGPASPTWYSVSTASNSDSAAVILSPFNLSQHIALLTPGDHVLAIHGLNVSNSSTDFLFSARLKASRVATGVTENAILYTGPVSLDQSVRVTARAYNGGEWSALSDALYRVNVAARIGDLALTEINYNPYAPSDAELAVDPTLDADDFEFIELLNISGKPLDLVGLRFTRGVDFDFEETLLTTTTSANTLLDVGAYAVFVRNPAAFALRYGTGINIIGVYDGKLDNSGEGLRLKDETGYNMFDFDYNDEGDWPERADGQGSSLELKEPLATNPYLYDKSSPWRSSRDFGGSPGRVGLEVEHHVVINEVLSRSLAPMRDYIELANRTTTQTVDLGGWFLSDSSADYFKFEIPSPREIDGGGYVTFTEGDFNPTPTSPSLHHFALDGAHGEAVYLMGKTESGTFFFADQIDFGPAAIGEPWGLWPNATGKPYLLDVRTSGTQNSVPRVGPVIISEIHYNPLPPEGATEENLEYIEMHNPTSATVNLTGWRIRKEVDFDFDTGGILSLAPGATLLIVPFDPADSALRASFAAVYQIELATPMVGPFIGRLDNAGARVQLQRADAPPADEPLYVPMLIEDDVDFNDKAPWPTAADGEGYSLTRKGTDLFGDDPASWIAAPPTPGQPLFQPANVSPTIETIPNQTILTENLCRIRTRVLGFPQPTVRVNGLPTWLKFDGINEIAGTPAAYNAYWNGLITIIAENEEGTTDSTFTLNVIPKPAPATIWMVK